MGTRGRSSGSRDRAPAPAGTTLAQSGMRATIEPDRHAPGDFTLVVDDTPQSHVSLGDPGYLQFEYVRRMGHLIDVARPPGESLTALHLGAGAFTLPRYIEHTRPGSRQQVVEYDPALVNLVRTHLPLPAGASIRVRHGDAREVLGRLPLGLQHSIDIVIVDLFVGSQTPRHVSSRQFFAQLPGLLAPGGLVSVNIADGSDQRFVRGQLATLRSVFAHTWLIVDPRVLKARRFGNYVAVAANDGLDLDVLPRLLASDPSPSRLLGKGELEQFVADAAAVDDSAATGSPPPARSVFHVRPQRLN